MDQQAFEFYDEPSLERPPTSMKDDLARWIDERFLKEGQYASFGKERVQVKRIAALCRSRCPTDPRGYAEAMVEGFAWLIEHDNEFWRSQPFTPSRLVAMWDSVKQQMKVLTAKRQQSKETHEKEQRVRGAGF